MAKTRLQIYVSSTTVDLGNCREKVAEQIDRLGCESVYMGKYSAHIQKPADKCRADVAECDAYVGLFGFRYGQIPDGEAISITEMELREAERNGIPMLVYLAKDSPEFPLAKYCEEDFDDFQRAIRFRKDLDRLSVTRKEFQDKDELLVCIPQAIIALQKELADTKLRSNTGGQLTADRTSPPNERFSTWRLPDTSGKLFGRDSEIAELERAWAERHTHIYCLIGFGGLGKSSIINEWIGGLATNDYGDAEHVFAWSFDSRERDQKEVSADFFFSAAYDFFRVPANEIPREPLEKGRKLALLIREARNLLILDGIESLQNLSDGRLEDRAILMLLKSFAEVNCGLCVVTSRMPIPDIQSWVGKTVVQRDLERLSTAAGIQLLQASEVTGSESALAAAVEEYYGHPLLLELLGSFLANCHYGDVTRRSDLDAAEEPALRLMKGHQRLLGDGPELDLLRVVSLFNRPVDGNTIDAVLAAPVIAGLTDHLFGMPRPTRIRAIQRLRKLRLLKGDNADRESLDADKVIREHFSGLLLHENPEAWREANSRLFDYYRSLPAEEQPETSADMEPLFQAVMHGCRSNRYREAWEEVEWPRIRRNDEGHSVLVIGAWKSDLAALESFFVRAWTRPVAQLSKDSQAWLFTETAFNLRGLGRLEEAMAPLKAGLELHKEVGDLWAASDAAGNLGEQLILYGDLSGADASAEESIRLALRAAGISSPEEAVSIAETALSNDSLKALKTLATNIATRAEVLHHQGRLEEARTAYGEAEGLYKRVSKEIRFLHGARGFHFCELLLDLQRYEEVVERSSANEKIDAAADRLYAVGLAKIVRAKALGASLPPSGVALAVVNDGVKTLGLAGQQELLLRGLLAAAQVATGVGEFELAQDYTNDVLERTVQGHIKLLYVDALVASAQLEKARKDFTKATDFCNRAEQEAKNLTYGRRLMELAALRAELQIHGSSPSK